MKPQRKTQMTFNPKIHHRRSIRLKDYDYSQSGGYFITLCTHNREDFFGEVLNENMNLNRCGEMVHESWDLIPNQFSNIELDEFIVMPNHVHGIIFIYDDDNRDSDDQKGLINQTPTTGTDLIPQILMKNPKTTLGKIVRAFKAKTAKIIHDSGNLDFQWQRNYYEHIIRGEKDLNAIRAYISNNPLQWSVDEENRNRESAKGFDKSNPNG
jgi:putative transposase